MICENCGEKKVLKNKLTRKGTTAFVDETGRRWDMSESRICPDCAHGPVVKMTKRKCRKCKDLLPQSYYFYCQKCTHDIRMNERANYDQESNYVARTRWNNTKH